MKPEDQRVGFVPVVVVGKPHARSRGSAAALDRDVAAFAGADVLPGLARDRRERQRRGLAAPCASDRARTAGRAAAAAAGPARRAAASAAARSGSAGLPAASGLAARARSPAAPRLPAAARLPAATCRAPGLSGDAGRSSRLSTTAARAGRLTGAASSRHSGCATAAGVASANAGLATARAAACRCRPDLPARAATAHARGATTTRAATTATAVRAWARRPPPGRGTPESARAPQYATRGREHARCRSCLLPPRWRLASSFVVDRRNRRTRNWRAAGRIVRNCQARCRRWTTGRGAERFFTTLPLVAMVILDAMTRTRCGPPVFGEDNLPDPWSSAILRRIQHGFSPVLVADQAYWEANKMSNANGDWPVSVPAIAKGATRTTNLLIFNDTFGGTTINVT